MKVVWLQLWHMSSIVVVLNLCVLAEDDVESEGDEGESMQQ